MAEHLASVPWLAKDLLWIVPDARCGLLPSMQVRPRSMTAQAVLCQVAVVQLGTQVQADPVSAVRMPAVTICLRQRHSQRVWS